jgi:DNA-directed RNA polymerase specialized sigma24 family protein
MTDRAQLDAWMAAAADGERAAIEPLFHALWPIVTRYTTHFVGDPTLAEDCTQETLVRLFGQLDRYDRERDALAWVLAIATWECRTARRRLTRRGETAAFEARDPAIDGVALAHDRAEVRAALATLGTLAERDLEVIAAAIEDGALRDALAPATFRKRLERALARFKLSWRSRHGTL